jgi:hypothetical protein
MSTVLRRTALVATALASSLILDASVARAQAPVSAGSDPLAVARALFSEALQDEEAGRFAVALAKFEQVRAVRDTASIEYRVATCHEGLGEPALAYGAYRAAIALGRDDPQSADVSVAASGRLDALGKRVARLTLLTPRPPLAGLDVRIDDTPVTEATAEPVPLEPGRHVVDATAPGATPFRRWIAVAAGDQASLAVDLPPGPVPAASVPAHGGGDSRKTAGWLALGGGVALAAASAVLIVARHEDIAALDRACPGGRCPAGADANDLEATRSRALVEGPVAVACGIAGIAAAGVGLYLLVARHGSIATAPPLAVAPLVARGGAGLAFVGAFR